MRHGNNILRIGLLLLACLAFSARASRRYEVTLLMVPRTDAMEKLGMEIAGKYPTLLVSYALGANGAVSLHGWTGSKWVNITPEAFAAGDFFKKAPDSVLIVEKEKVPVPEKLVPPVDWAPNVSRITTTQLRPLIHLAGQYFDFGYKDWKWFSDRYRLEMDAINPEGLNVKWYNKRMVDHFGGAKGQGQGASDLQYWVLVRQAVAVEPAVPVEEEPRTNAVEEVENPFTGEVPAAEVLGAPDAQEDVE